MTFKLYVQLHDKNLFTLAYPFCLFVYPVSFEMVEMPRRGG